MADETKVTDEKADNPSELNENELDDAQGGNFLNQAQQFMSSTQKKLHDAANSVIKKI